jgi:hypothetical protein
LRYGVCIPERPALRLESAVLLTRQAPRSLLPQRIAVRPVEHDVVVSRDVEGTVTAPQTFRRVTKPIPGEPRD